MSNLFESEAVARDTLPDAVHIEMWKGLIFSDEGQVFLRAAATAHGYSFRDGQVVDETDKVVSGSELEPVVHDAARQAVVEKPLWRKV